MEKTMWMTIFQSKVKGLNPGDNWRLEFDDTLVPDSPEPGWKKYIRTTSARFRCRRCGRSWPSNRVMVIFHMSLNYRQGIVKVRRFRQNCKICTEAPMEEPCIDRDNIEVLLDNLVKKIRIKCYNEPEEKHYRDHIHLEVKSPHEPEHCEGCKAGICNRN